MAQGARARAADIQPVDSPNLIPLIPCRPKRNRVSVPVGERGRASRPRAAYCRRRQSRAALLLWVDARARSAPSVRLLAPPRARASSDVRPATRGLREQLRDERHNRPTCGTSDSGVAALLDKERQRSERRSTAAAASARLRARIRHRSMMSWLPCAIEEMEVLSRTSLTHPLPPMGGERAGYGRQPPPPPQPPLPPPLPPQPQLPLPPPVEVEQHVYEVLPASIYITHLRSACGDPARCPHSCTSWLYRCGHLHATTTGARSTCALVSGVAVEKRAARSAY